MYKGKMFCNREIICQTIADVAVTKRHQRRDEIRIMFTRTSSKSCSQTNCHAIYTPSTLNVIQFAQHTLAINTPVLHSIRLLEIGMFPTEKTTFLIPVYSAGKNYQDSFCRWWLFLTATCAICNVELVVLANAYFMLLVKCIN